MYKKEYSNLFPYQIYNIITPFNPLYFTKYDMTWHNVDR